MKEIITTGIWSTNNFPVCIIEIKILIEQNRQDQIRNCALCQSSIHFDDWFLSLFHFNAKFHWLHLYYNKMLIKFNIWFSVFSFPCLNFSGIVFLHINFMDMSWNVTHIHIDTLTILSCNQSGLYEMFQSCNENSGLNRSNYSYSPIISFLNFVRCNFHGIATFQLNQFKRTETIDRHMKTTKKTFSNFDVCSDLA